MRRSSAIVCIMYTIRIGVRVGAKNWKICKCECREDWRGGNGVVIMQVDAQLATYLLDGRAALDYDWMVRLGDMVTG